MEFVHPRVTILDDSEDLPEPRILPVYPLTDGVKQSDLRKLSSDVSRQLAGDLESDAAGAQIPRPPLAPVVVIRQAVLHRESHRGSRVQTSLLRGLLLFVRRGLALPR